MSLTPDSSRLRIRRIRFVLEQLPVRSVLRKLLRPVTETRKEKETTATSETNTAIRDKTVTGTVTEIVTAARVITVTATRAVIKDTTMTTAAMMATTMAAATGRLSTVIKALLNHQLPVKATTAIVTTTDDIPLRPSRLSTLSKRLPWVAKAKGVVISVARRNITVLPVRTTMLS
jgi:hypothetical protein